MSIDKVLAALDAGLQSSEERGYPERIDDATLCARCIVHEPAPTADICAPCRAFLLGDSDVDPRQRDSHGSFLDALIDSMSRPVEHGARAATALASRWTDPDRWSIDYTYVGDGRRVVHYSANDVHGQYATDDERPFTVRLRYLDDRLLRATLVNADDMVCHSVTLAAEYGGGAIHHLNGDGHDNRPENLVMVPARENVGRPAAFRVASGSDVPEYYVVTCDRCHAIYACDPQRTQEAAEIMYADGHGLAGACDPLTRMHVAPSDCPPVPDEVVSFVSHCVTYETPVPYDWATEAPAMT